MEILITIVILGTMASLIIPRYTVAVEKGISAEGVNILGALREAQLRYALIHNGTYATTIGQLDISIPNSSNFFSPGITFFGGVGYIVRKNTDGSGAYTVNCTAFCSSYTITTNTAYALGISVDGTIRCFDGPSPICGKMGY